MYYYIMFFNIIFIAIAYGNIHIDVLFHLKKGMGECFQIKEKCERKLLLRNLYFCSLRKSVYFKRKEGMRLNIIHSCFWACMEMESEK